MPTLIIYDKDDKKVAEHEHYHRASVVEGGAFFVQDHKNVRYWYAAGAWDYVQETPDED